VSFNPVKGIGASARQPPGAVAERTVNQETNGGKYVAIYQGSTWRLMKVRPLIPHVLV
jgi:hypothetical protein